MSLFCTLVRALNLKDGKHSKGDDAADSRTLTDAERKHIRSTVARAFRESFLRRVIRHWPL